MKTEFDVKKAVANLWESLVEFVPINYRKYLKTSWAPEVEIQKVLAQHLIQAYKAGIIDGENIVYDKLHNEFSEDRLRELNLWRNDHE